MVVYCVYSLSVSFLSLLYGCPSLKCPVGLCYMDTCSAEGLVLLRHSSSHFPGLCRLVLTCSHDSLFLWYPAIGMVWRGPVSLALGFLSPLAVSGSAWWSPSPGWCSVQSFSRMSVLSILWQLQYSSCGIGSGINPNGEFVSVLCLRSLCFYSFTITHPAIRVHGWNRAN